MVKVLLIVSFLLVLIAVVAAAPKRDQNDDNDKPMNPEEVQRILDAIQKENPDFFKAIKRVQKQNRRQKAI